MVFAPFCYSWFILSLLYKEGRHLVQTQYCIGGQAKIGTEMMKLISADWHDIYSTGHWHCSTYTCVNSVQYGGFPRKIHAKNSRAFTRRIFTSKFECLFKVTDFPYKNTLKLRVTANVADIN